MLQSISITDVTKHTMQYEFGKLLSAAVVSSQFRSLLLTDPGKAIRSGFAGENFELTSEARTKIESIHATSLVEFASQLNSCI
ncbi:MAG TPA: hypothetical protein PKD55_02810 [Bellilinea sp.]|nr:hypothetical protein [Bellilinea sp.]